MHLSVHLTRAAQRFALLAAAVLVAGCMGNTGPQVTQQAAPVEYVAPERYKRVDIDFAPYTQALDHVLADKEAEVRVQHKRQPDLGVLISFEDKVRDRVHGEEHCYHINMFEVDANGTYTAAPQIREAMMNPDGKPRPHYVCGANGSYRVYLNKRSS